MRSDLPDFTKYKPLQQISTRFQNSFDWVMMKVFKSFACRIELTTAIIALAAAQFKHSVDGMVKVPVDVLQPRQVKLTRDPEYIALNPAIPASLVFHRDAYVPVISRSVAERLVDEGAASYCDQSLLFYTMDQYLKDPDVLAKPEEVEAAKNSGADLVLVAVVGDSRSALSVCRNIVSGCQKLQSVVADAAGAVDAASVFLIEG